MSDKEAPSSNSEPRWLEPSEEAPFKPTDPFWTNTSFHGSDAQLVAGVAVHVGLEVAHEAKEGVKSVLKGLLGIR